MGGMSNSALVGEHKEFRLQGRNSSVRIYRPAPRVVVMVLAGTDVGEHGNAPFAELSRDYEEGAFELFIDARDTRGVALDVSGGWARWMSERRDSLRRVNMLTGSRFVEITANFVRDFAELGGRMRIYTDPEAFDTALTEAGRSASSTRLRIQA
jgi:hypothetical protein